MEIRGILDKIDDKGLDNNELKSLLKVLDEEIRSLKLPDKKILVDKTGDTTVLMEIRNGKRELVKMTDIEPMTVTSQFEGLHIPFSTVRKYVTKKNIEDLLSSE